MWLRCLYQGWLMQARDDQLQIAPVKLVSLYLSDRVPSQPSPRLGPGYAQPHESSPKARLMWAAALEV